MSDTKITQKGMSKDQYRAIRQLRAVQSMFEKQVLPDLQERARDLIPDGKLEIELAGKFLKSLTDHMIQTIPLNRKKQMDLELQHTYMDVVTRFSDPPMPPNYVALTEDTLIKLMAMGQGEQCDLCAKSGREVDRCPVRVLFDSCLMYQHKRREDGSCPYTEFKIE